MDTDSENRLGRIAAEWVEIAGRGQPLVRQRRKMTELEGAELLRQELVGLGQLVPHNIENELERSLAGGSDPRSSIVFHNKVVSALG